MSGRQGQIVVARGSMVWRGMGLLDDAIREHLELRRRRGADPGLVTREEHEALGPGLGLADAHDLGADLHIADPHAIEPDEQGVLGDDDAYIEHVELAPRLFVEEPAHDSVHHAASTSQDHERVAVCENSRQESLAVEGVDGPEVSFSHVGQETAELDMRTVFGESDDHDLGSPALHSNDSGP
jgi:hypothetical protein